MHLTIISAFILSSVFSPISREEAAKCEPISVTGVVTCVAYWQKSSCVIAAPEDPNGPAIYIAGEKLDKPHAIEIENGPVSVGDLVAVDGVRTPMFFAPGVAAKRITRIGAQELPRPPEYRLADFAGGRLDNRRVKIGGVVREVYEYAPNTSGARLFTDDGFVELRIKVPAKEMLPLVDAEIKAIGVAMSFFNQRAEFLGVRFEVDRRGDIEVVKESAEDPFTAPLSEIPTLLAWRPEGNDGHARRIRGTVTATRQNLVTLQNGANAIRVAVVGEVPPPGAKIEAVGFPELSDDVGIVRGATWRRYEGDLPTPQPVRLDLAELSKIEVYDRDRYFDYDSLLVTINGRLSRAPGGALTLSGAGHDVRVIAEDGVADEVARYLDYSPNVRLRGVARVKFDWSFAEGRRIGISEVSLLTRSKDDFTLVRTAELDAAVLASYGRFAIYLVAVVALVIACGFGVTLLRHNRQRREEKLLGEERKRMAGDLHDTIEQHLAGAKILLTTALGQRGSMNPAAESAITVAADVLMEAKRQIRDVILNLRNEELMKKPLRELIRSVAEAVNRQGAVRVRVMLRGIPDELKAGVKTDLVAIVQQAITNAIKHGKAKNVVVAADPAEGAGPLAATNPAHGRGGFCLRVANDGEPFDAATALGPDAGHFGLSSMRERAKRSGFKFEIKLDGRWTVVELVKEGE